MDELLNQRQATGIGCHIRHEYYGPLWYADDLKLLCPCLKGLQKMIMICEQYGDRFSVSYNVKKSMCITFDRVVDWSRRFNESISITPNGNRLKWVNCVKDLGNYVLYDLSDMEEIIHKRADLIWRANGILAWYQDANPEVKMYLLNAYGCHLYGSQAWCYSDKNVESIIIAWNKTIQQICNLPFDSYRAILNKGLHLWDYIYKRFCKMYECMLKSENSKLSMLVRMSQDDRRCILERNVRQICARWDVSEIELLQKWKLWRLSVFNTDEMNQCERVIEMIK